MHEDQMKTHEHNMKIVRTFCISGALKMKRIDAIVMIHNKTNARFVSMVSKNTDYLISSRKDTNKAAIAKMYGTRVLDESEMMAFVKRGKFPSVRL